MKKELKKILFSLGVVCFIIIASVLDSFWFNQRTFVEYLFLNLFEVLIFFIGVSIGEMSA